MKTANAILAVFCLVLAGMWLVPRAQAQNPNGEIILTVAQPVEVPDRVLTAGKYELRFIDDTTHVVEITGPKQEVVGLYFVTPVLREHITGHTQVVLERAGSMERIREWFDPGERWGYELEYPNHLPVVAQSKASHHGVGM